VKSPNPAFSHVEVPLVTTFILSSDPPYYDNVGYADISDFFYVWLRHTLKSVVPSLFSTLVTPKAEELVATPYRHSNKEAAETFFINGMSQTIRNLVNQINQVLPIPKLDKKS
jgi:putative DNA methylase